MKRQGSVSTPRDIPVVPQTSVGNVERNVRSTEENDPFKKSGRVARSPPTTSSSVDVTGENTLVNRTILAKGTPEVQEISAVARHVEEITVQSGVSCSPRVELIYKMRKCEEESLAQCKAILKKMKLAILRQKNVSNDIKDGISELDEQFDVMERYRKSWKMTEKERMESQSSNSITIRENIEPETPLTHAKRIASSPPEDTSNTSKKMREKEPQGWQMVQKKPGKNLPPEEKQPAKGRKITKENQNRPKRVKPEAVLIKPSDGTSYADVLKNLRTKMQPSEAAKLKGIRKTRTGALLLELNRGEKVQTKFVEELKSTVKQAGIVTELKPMATLEIRDLDSFTVQEEVEEAIKKLLGDSNEVLRIRITTPNSREQVRAFVTLSAENAAILLKLAKVRIGWIQAKIRPWVNTKRCFRCLETGHVRVDCKGKDRSSLCFKCGDPGHKISECAKPTKCCLCVDAGRERVDHFPGSRRCPEFEILQA